MRQHWGEEGALKLMMGGVDLHHWCTLLQLQELSNQMPPNIENLPISCTYGYLTQPDLQNVEEWIKLVIVNTTKTKNCIEMQIIHILKSLDLLSNNKFLSSSSLSGLVKIRVGQLASRECWGISTKNWRRRYSHQFWTWPVRYSFFMIYISTTFGFDSVWILKIYKLRGQCVNVNVSYGWFLRSNCRFRVFSDSS